jgi:hypothetical protein
MIYKQEISSHLNPEITNRIGECISKNQDVFSRSIGSCFYSLRELNIVENTGNISIQENARCHFELFEKGLLLRINDGQDYFVLPIAENEKLNVELGHKEKKVKLSSFSGLLLALGFKKSLLRKYWLLSRGFYSERFTLNIATGSENIILDSSNGNFKDRLNFLEKGNVEAKIRRVKGNVFLIRKWIVILFSLILIIACSWEIADQADLLDIPSNKNDHFAALQIREIHDNPDIDTNKKDLLIQEINLARESKRKGSIIATKVISLDLILIVMQLVIIVLILFPNKKRIPYREEGII